MMGGSTHDQDELENLLISLKKLDVKNELTPETKSSYVSLAKTTEIKDLEIKQQFLIPSNELQWDLLDEFQEVPRPDLVKFYNSLPSLPQPISRTSFRFKRNGIGGNIVGYKEELNLSEVNAGAVSSLSIKRQFTSKADALKGKTAFLPFQPGGISIDKSLKASDNTAFLHRDKDGLFDIPQGFSRGFDLQTVNENDSEIKNFESSIEPSSKEETKNEQNSTELDLSELVDTSAKKSHKISEIDDLLPADYNIYSSTIKSQDTSFKKDWAHVIDLNHNLENFHELVPQMARQWPFELDTFQKEAVYHLEQGDSVFVAAHTSAGKTVVAEYAIAMSNRNMTKTIYTSPIKALSNQKFRDFKQDFQEIDVGLITGDVQINPEANCLIMTTEILRSMLYRGADLIRDVEFVIFDEVHYVNDIDRGVVWEEVIIMLPDHVKFILLSATVPNTFEFANWVGRTKKKDIYVISTPKRPVPLEIFIWAKNDLHKVVDSQRKFIDSGFRSHKDALEKPVKDQKSISDRGGRGGRGGNIRGTGRGGNTRGGPNSRGNTMAARGRGNFNNRSGGKNFNRDGPNKNTWINLVQYLRQKNLLPAVTFVFSKKKCEEYADSLTSVDFCNAKEKSEIHMFMDNAVSRLKKEDRQLPQILKIREMLSRGIAVHHGGLLPIVKECIEILFSKTLVKVLFATETFAMGLNLPTRTVIFSNLRKHDGKGFRNLLPGEFTQMSGRAGRRGLDPTGTVIVMSYNEPLSPTDFKEVTLGNPTKLSSQFRLTYNMILNLLRIEALRVEEMIKHSFSENSTQVLLPEHKKNVEALTEELKVLELSDCENCGLSELDVVHSELIEYQKIYTELITEIMKTSLVKSKLNIGRLILYRDENNVLRPGFITRTEVSKNQFVVLTFKLGEDYEEESKSLDIPYLPRDKLSQKFHPKLKYNGSLHFRAAPFESVQFVGRYSLKTNLNEIIKLNPEALKEAEENIKTLIQYQRKWEEISWDGVTKLNVHEIIKKKQDLLERIKKHACVYCPLFVKHFSQINIQYQVKSQIKSLQMLISDENLELLPAYQQRLEVLKSLGFVDHNLNVVLKGRVACEINSGWELVITELVLDNFLGEFEPEEIVALLSCFIYEGRTNEEEEIAITPRLEKGKVKIKEITEKLLSNYQLNQVPLTSEEEEFLERKRFALVNVVYEWARGMSFNDIMELSVESEGTIVRVITRLDEVCREVKAAALIIGDSALHSKMSEAQEKIKRDIVFCASLYL